MTILNIVEIASGALLLIAFIYGLLRKFSRMTWSAWQIALVFAATLLIGVLPEGGSEWVRFLVAAGALLGVTALVLFLGGLLRKPFLAAEGGGGGVRFFNRLLGGLTAVVDLALIAVILGGFALTVLSVTPLGETLSDVYDHALWKFFGPYAIDLVLVTLFLMFVRRGYRTGLLRSIVMLLLFALTFLAVYGAILLVFRWSFLRSFAGTVAGGFSSLSPFVAGTIGYAIVWAIVFLIFFIVIVLIGFLLHKLLLKAGNSLVFGVFDGLVLSLIFFVVFIALIAAFDYGVFRAATLSMSELGVNGMDGLGEAVNSFAGKIGEIICSSPLSKLFYECNPLRLFL